MNACVGALGSEAARAADKTGRVANRTKRALPARSSSGVHDRFYNVHTMYFAVEP